jgi:hypothetical protein
MSVAQLILFFLLCLSIVYFGNSLFAKKFIKIEPKTAAVYISAMMMIGIFGEIFVNKSYDVLFGHPLWTYQIMPIHGGLSSKYAVWLWGIYGLHIYLLHGALDGRRFNEKHYMKYVFWLEGVAVEFITNSLFLLCFHRYLFYYPASDLWHITSMQGFPCYFAAGYIITRSLAHFKKDPRFFIPMTLLLTAVVVFFI